MVAAGKPPSTANLLDGLNAMSSSEAMQELWDGMEVAESGYEAALLARLAALEKEAREKETDDMLLPLIDAAKDMIGWTNGKTKEMNEVRTRRYPPLTPTTLAPPHQQPPPA